MYLEPIFSAPDIQRQLPVEAKQFFHTDKQYKEVMRRAKDRPNALLAGTAPGLLEVRGGRSMLTGNDGPRPAPLPRPCHVFQASSGERSQVTNQSGM